MSTRVPMRNDFPLNGQQTAALGIFFVQTSPGFFGREREAAPSNPNMARGLLAAALVACAAVAQEVQMEARASGRCPLCR